MVSGVAVAFWSGHREVRNADAALGIRPDVPSLADGADRAVSGLTAVGRSMDAVHGQLGRLAQDMDDARGRASLLASRVESLERAIASRDRVARTFGLFASTLAHGARWPIPLLPATSTGRAVGWAVWDPVRRSLFVYAVGLPRVRGPWSVENTTRPGRTAMERLEDGGLWAAIEPIVSPGCTMGVRIVPPDADRVVLHGSVTLCRHHPPA